MKRKLKIGLTLEIIILFAISLVISIFLVIMTCKKFDITAYKINKKLFPLDYKDEMILKNYRDFITPKVDKAISSNIDNLKIPHKMDDKLKNEVPYDFHGKTLIFIVNSEGEILNSNNEEDVYCIKKEVIQGELGVKIKKYSDNMTVNIIEIKKLSDDLYMVLTNDMVVRGDISLVIMVIVTWMIIFSILTKGRLRYIIFIKKGINKLYASEFEEKIPLKYNNEITSLAIALNDMGGKIKENKENEKEFLLNISHDLRTPLTSILGFLNLIKEKKYDSEEERERYGKIVEEQCIYLKILIDEFFEFSKLKWQNTKLNKENIKLQEILWQISDGFYPQLKEYNINLNMNLPQKPLYKEVDVDKFMRVLENILSNAIKYSHKESEIRVNLYEDKNRVVIEFWNSPIDEIKEEELKFLFKRFYKKDLSRNSKGAGLGLAIALEIIRLHEGKIDAVLKDERLGLIIRL